MILVFGPPAAVVITVILIRLGLTRFGRLPAVGGGLKVLMLIVLLLGIYLTYIESASISRMEAVRSWPSVPGLVVECKIVGERAIRPEVTYEYQVGDSVYRAVTDLSAPMFGGKRKKFDVAAELAEHYAVGTKVVVHYNPKEAAESTLTAHAQWSVFGRLAVGLILAGFGLFAVSLPRRRDPAPGKAGA